MPATKNSKSRTTKQASKTTREKETNEEERMEDEDEVVVPKSPAKSSPLLEIDDADPLISIEDKLAEEDPLHPSDLEDDEMSDIGLDGEDINPFGDRWEE